MINAQPSFIPLFFDEAEMDLWIALQRIEPEERSSFIKSILRQALLGDRIEELIMKEKQNPEGDLLVKEENSGLSDKELSADFPEDGLESIESFTLDALFEVIVPAQDKGDVVGSDLESLKESQPKENQAIRSAGFEYMMKHIIGTEEDEAVLKVLRSYPSQKR